MHTLARSRFPIGDHIEEVDEFGMHKLVGSGGVFATQVVSQAATAMPNEGVPSLGGHYSPGGYEMQNEAVVEYLTAAGLPDDQILSATDNETGITPPTSRDALEGAIVVGWFTVLHRGYEGVPIEDSTAWSILDDAGASLEEQVFWPAMGPAIVADVEKFNAVLANHAAREKFVQRLPATYTEGHVVIHHTTWEWNGPFEAVFAIASRSVAGRRASISQGTWFSYRTS